MSRNELTPTDPTPDEVERAKKWAAMQTPPVTVEPMSEAASYIRCVPFWLVQNMANLHVSNDAAWTALARALRPVFASVAPIVREECAAVCDASVNWRQSPHIQIGLQHAAVAHARELAGLPPLKWRTDADNPRLNGPADRPVHAGNRPNDRLAGAELSQ